MNCAFHADVENAAFCIKCGKALCAQCVRQVQSSIYCESCLAESLGESAGTAGQRQPAHSAARADGRRRQPGSRFSPRTDSRCRRHLQRRVLQGRASSADFWDARDGYGSLAGSGEALFALLAFGFYVYMPFEAFYTTKKRKLAREGINLITPFDNFNEQFGDMELWGGIALVVLGVIFLLRHFRHPSSGEGRKDLASPVDSGWTCLHSPFSEG